MITTATYAGESNLLVHIEPEGILVSSSNEELVDWVGEGNSISPYEFPIEQAQDSKILEAVNYAETLVSQAYSNPKHGVSNLDPVAYRAVVETHRKHNLDSLTVGQALSTEDTEQALVNETLSGYELDILGDVDLIRDTVMTLGTSSQITAIDIPSQTWTLWVPM